MRILAPLATIFAASPVLAEAFHTPVPMAQTATAEVSFALASAGLLLCLVVVQWLVGRR